MTAGAPAAIYAVDTSSLMDWYARYYPTDVFPGILGRLEDLVAARRLTAPGLVKEEIEAVGPAGLKEWVDAHPTLIVPTREVLAVAVAMQNQFAGLRDAKAEHEEADASVIALARQRGRVVATQETPAGEKRNPKRTHYIPDVCRESGIASVSFLGLMRRERWRF